MGELFGFDTSFFEEIYPAETLKARRMLLRAMTEDDRAYDGVISLRTDLGELYRASDAFSTAECGIEHAFAFYRLAACFSRTVKSIRRLFDSPFCKLLKNEVASVDAAAFDLALTEYKALLDTLRAHGFALSDTAFSLRECENEGDFSMHLSKLCQMLDLPQVPERPRVEKSLPRGVLRILSERHKSELAALADLEARLNGSVNTDIAGLRRELDIYIALCDLFRKQSENGAPLCFPEISPTPCFYAENMIDPALLPGLECTKHIVANNAAFTAEKPRYFLMGANGGGKTSYLRATAINLILFLCGCPCFCKSGSIFPFEALDVFFTENERYADVGRFEEEKRRVDSAAARADGKTFLFFNETFAGTDAKNAARTIEELMQSLAEKGTFALFVTHFHSLAESKIPTLGVMVAADGRRLYKIAKNDEVLSSHARDILKKYHLDSASIAERSAGK